MESKNTVRVLWLLNHTTFRNFELPQLNKVGLTEIFTPKIFGYSEANLSASVDYSLDAALSIPQDCLEVLNAQNWYEQPSEEAWAIANKYFDIAIIGFFPAQITEVVTHFKGSIVLRAFGLEKELSYTKVLYDIIGVHGMEKIRKIKSRFWFGAGYAHLANIEGPLFQETNCYLPIGLSKVDVQDKWIGSNKRILFVCPRINTSLYFNTVYKNFIKDFSDFDYTIGGAQPIEVDDPNVIGFVSNEIHQHNMQSHRLMFYHSTEPNHIHYHPFEAIRAGMPLVFMAGGLLDSIGGVGLWGRCKNIKEAKSKIKELLKDNPKLIDSIKNEQKRLLHAMNPEVCAPYIAEGFNRILSELHLRKKESNITPPKYRVAIIIPIEYRGGSLRGAILFANSLCNGSASLGDNVEVIFAHLDTPNLYKNSDFAGLHPQVIRRPYKWKVLRKREAIRAMCYANHPDWVPEHSHYYAPNDGINHLLDCDLWICISDRLEMPLLPIKPHALMVYDYIQRHINFCPNAFQLLLIRRAQEAMRILVTTQFTADNAVQYAGVDPSSVSKMPMLVPDFQAGKTRTRANVDKQDVNYFIWTTNTARHKNHLNVFQALKIYYEELNGQLECHITGCDSNNLLKNSPDNEELNRIFKSSVKLQQFIKFFGELSDHSYQDKLINSQFLFHAALMDNGTFSVVEAAQLGVPSLSSDYPPMQEINERFNLNLKWMEANSPDDIAYQLADMELVAQEMKEQLLKQDINQFKHNQNEEIACWKVVKECL